MKVDAIRDCIDSYIEYLHSDHAHRWAYIYSAIDHFHRHWDLSADDLFRQFDKSLHSQVSRRLWHRESFDARGMMLRFIQLEPDYAKQMFRDLYDESKAIDARIDRFRFYCDEFLSILRHREATGKIQSHDQDASMISFYLAGRYPETYAIYPGYPAFEKSLQNLGSPHPAKFDDLERFFKVCRAINTIGRKEGRLQKALEKRFIQRPEHARYIQWTSELMLWMGEDPLF